MNTETDNNEYKCAFCGGVFLKGWSDEESEKELNEDFPGWTPEDCNLVCDDCYKVWKSEE